MPSLLLKHLFVEGSLVGRSSIDERIHIWLYMKTVS